MDLMEHLAKNEKGNQNVPVITYRYYKATRIIHLSKEIETTVARSFEYHCIIPYFVPNLVLTKNWPLVTVKLFISMGGYLGVNHLKTKDHNPQANDKTERYNNTLVSSLRQYMGENHKYWYEYVQ